MKTLLFLFILLTIWNISLGQGINAGDIVTSVDGSSKNASIGINTFSQEPHTEIIVDWGDGFIDTVSGPSFLISQNLYLNLYQGYHTYLDTGYYTIKHTDDYWIDGIANFDDSGIQPFTLEAKIWLSNDVIFSQNSSIFFSAPADYIYQDNGVVTHELVPTDIDLDSISQKLIPVPAPDYFLPNATDSLVCCLIWDKPTEPGKYAFGFEVEDWRYGKRMSSVQRFITVQVDTIFSQDSEKEYIERGFVVFQNPTDFDLRIFFSGSFVPGNSYSLSISDEMGKMFYRKSIKLLEFAGGLFIDVSTWPYGLYFISLTVGSQIWVEKVVVR